MKRFLFISLLITNVICFGQYDMEDNQKENDKPKKEKNVTPLAIKERTYVGGELALRFGNFTYIYVAPFIGFDFVKTFSGGVSTMYQFYREFNPFTGQSFSTHAYGGGVFLRFRPIRQILLQTEFNLYNTQDFSTNAFLGDRVNVPVFMAGGGYAGSLGEKSYYQVMLLYDFIQNESNPIPPLIRGIPLYLRYGLVFYLD